MDEGIDVDVTTKPAVDSVESTVADDPGKRAYLGYLFVIIATTLWGSSVVLAKTWFRSLSATPLLVSQMRVTFAWLYVFLFVLVRCPQHLRVRPGDLWRFALLGIIGTSGANFLLYFAVARMDSAVADLIQFTAPIIVSIYLWLRGREAMDRPKIVALALSIFGSSMALGLWRGHAANISVIGTGAAVMSALCYSFLIVWGKGLSGRYPIPAFLHYSLLAAMLFWFVAAPWRPFLTGITTLHSLGTFALFGLISVALPYVFFYSGLKLVPASRAAIVSMWEPVMIAISAWPLLGERLHITQGIGIALVIAAIVLVETTSGKAQESN